jgi:hypothetical protein
MLKIILSVMLLIVVLFSILDDLAFSRTYFVATKGNDANPGTLENPFATISRGASALMPGDTLYIRGGIYHENVRIGRSGTKAARIRVAGYLSERAIIDGSYLIPLGAFNPLFNVSGNYVTVQDLTIIRSKGGGLEISGNYLNAVNLLVSQNMENGILIRRGYSTVDNCDVYSNALSNVKGAKRGGGWGAGITVCQGGHHSTIQNSRSWNNWGEGISSWSGAEGISDFNTIQNNISFDNYSNQIYLSNTQHALVQKNILYVSPNNPCSGFQRGIEYGDEKPYHPNDGNRIINNFVMGCDYNFSWWGGFSGNGLKNSLIAFNTFVNAQRRANFRIDDGKGTAVHDGCRILNNIFLQENALPITEVSFVGGIRFSNNLWSKTPLPAARGIGDVLGDPQLKKSGPTDAGLLTPEYFKIKPSSPGRGKGKPLVEVQDDFFGSPRGMSPDIGGHQYGGGG